MLTNLKTIVDEAYAKKYAVGSFNGYNSETFRGIIEAGVETKTPIILAFGAKYLSNMSLSMAAAVTKTLAADLDIPVCLHLDHCKDMNVVFQALKAGFGSVMYDGSMLPYEENLANTKKVCEVAHACGASVEAELGSIAAGEKSHEGSASDVQAYTDPKLAGEFVRETGVDALAHCIECFTSNKANPFSDMYALEGCDLILNNIERACDDPEAMEEKNRMQMAAYYGGLAITASGTTAVHALSYPLGGKYHIAHGVSNAILLAPVMRFNAQDPAFRERLALAYDRCCHDKVKCETVDEKSAWMIAKMEGIVKHLDIPTSLKEFGVPESDLEGLVEAGMQVQRLLVNNMRLVTAEDARKLYQEIM